MRGLANGTTNERATQVNCIYMLGSPSPKEGPNWRPNRGPKYWQAQTRNFVGGDRMRDRNIRGGDRMRDRNIIRRETRPKSIRSHHSVPIRSSIRSHHFLFLNSVPPFGPIIVLEKRKISLLIQSTKHGTASHDISSLEQTSQQSHSSHPTPFLALVHAWRLPNS
jgi:hypothetical protein